MQHVYKILNIIKICYYACPTEFDPQRESVLMPKQQYFNYNRMMNMIFLMVDINLMTRSTNFIASRTEIQRGGQNQATLIASCSKAEAPTPVKYHSMVLKCEEHGIFRKLWPDNLSIQHATGTHFNHMRHTTQLLCRQGDQPLARVVNAIQYSHLLRQAYNCCRLKSFDTLGKVFQVSSCPFLIKISKIWVGTVDQNIYIKDCNSY